MFSRSSLLFTVFAAASAVLAGPIQARNPVDPTCLPKDIEPSCLVLVNDCLTWAVPSGKDGLWYHRSCVAAATCYGVGNLESKVACNDDWSVTNQEQDSLEYSIYASIVGDCAYATNGCPITEQNYIDFYYGSLSAIGANTWPSSSSVVIAWWQSINAWTATGSTIPYTHFNDWLHYSTYPPPFTTSYTTTVTPTTITVPTSTVIISTSTSSTVTVSLSTSTLATPTIVTVTSTLLPSIPGSVVTVTATSAA